MPLLLLAFACAPPDPDDTAPATATPVAWEAPGAWRAGTVSVALTVGTAGGDARDVPARIWYPTDADAADVALADLVDDPDDRATLAGLLAAAPAGCPATRNAAIPDAPPAAGDHPLVVVSHCHTCLGISGATIAAHLATHGFVAIAPDHLGNTLFDALAGDGGTLDEATLARRAADLDAAIDAALDGSALPDGLAVDPARVGVLGHSFGAVTAGRVVGTDPRVKAAMAMGAPIDNPLLDGVDATTVTAPVLLLLLEEDHSVGAAGNLLIESNFEALAGPAWLARMPDGGHWSVSDLCGVVEGFLPGCGEDTRQERGGAFTYVPADAARAATAGLAAAFFSHTLNEDAGAGAWLSEPDGPVELDVTSR